MQGGGRRFEPGWLHLTSPLKPGLLAALVALLTLVVVLGVALGGAYVHARQFGGTPAQLSIEKVRDNLFVIITARGLNPKLRLVSP